VTNKEEHASELVDLVREILNEGGEAANAYLRQSWLTQCVEALGQIRKNVGLTQSQVAERLRTTQSAIARLENDHRGSLSLRRFVDYAIACEAFPLDVEFSEVGALRKYIADNPAAERTASLVRRWWTIQQERSEIDQGVPSVQVGGTTNEDSLRAALDSALTGESAHNAETAAAAATFVPYPTSFSWNTPLFDPTAGILPGADPDLSLGLTYSYGRPTTAASYTGVWSGGTAGRSEPNDERPTNTSALVKLAA
jgi:transcriptional regulator with XRE-family HTH domain